MTLTTTQGPYDDSSSRHGARVPTWPWQTSIYTACTQESNQDLPPCRWILYHLSHQGSPRILEWVDYLFSSRSSRPRN